MGIFLVGLSVVVDVAGVGMSLVGCIGADIGFADAGICLADLGVVKMSVDEVDVSMYVVDSSVVDKGSVDVGAVDMVVVDVGWRSVSNVGANKMDVGLYELHYVSEASVNFADQQSVV